MQAGEYEFPAGTSPLEASAIIASGKTVRHKLTIPEGLTSAEVIALVQAAPALAGPTGAPPPEGSLMPDTYLYSYGERRTELIEQMQREMRHALAAAWSKRQSDLPLVTPQQMLTLASLVESEAAHADERAHIAGVFINRLRLGMRLECDPTVVYALSDGGAKKARPAADPQRSTDAVPLQHLPRDRASARPNRQPGDGGAPCCRSAGADG